MVKKHEISIPQRKGLRWFILLSILGCEFMTHAWVRTESTQAILRISQAQTEIQKALSYRKALGLERDRLKSDARITRIARSRFGMTFDVSDRTIYLPENGLNTESKGML